MLIKSPDDPTPTIEALAGLLDRPALAKRTQHAIERELRTLRAGLKAERDAMHQIEFHYGHSRNVMTLHDLRLERDGDVAQIDHVVVNRLLEVWVCESKAFSDVVEVNEHGEWSASYRGRLRGIPSPIEQNRRHIKVLERLIADGALKLPKRVGITLKPTMKSLILLSDGSRIARPAAGVRVPGLDTVIKADQLETTISRAVDEAPARDLVKFLSRSEVESIARQLAGLHRPRDIDWHTRVWAPRLHGLASACVTSARLECGASSATGPVNRFRVRTGAWDDVRQLRTERHGAGGGVQPGTSRAFWGARLVFRLPAAHRVGFTLTLFSGIDLLGRIPR